MNRINRNRGEVLFFTGTGGPVWCTSITDTDDELIGYVQHGDWYLRYDKHNHIQYSNGSRVPFQINCVLMHRVKVHWPSLSHQNKNKWCWSEYNSVIDRAINELTNPTEPEIPEPEILTRDEMLDAFCKNSIVSCEYDYAQYQCETIFNGVVKVVYTRDKDDFDNTVPF